MSRFARRLQNASLNLVTSTVVTVSNITATTVTLTWTIVPGATGYLVGRNGTDANGNGPYQTVDGPNVVSRVFISLLPNTQYTLFCEPQPGGLRKSIVVTTAIADTVVTTSNITSSTATLNWTSVAGATGYLVGRNGTDANGNGPYQTVDSTSATSRTFINLLPSTQYTLFCEPQQGGARKTVSITTSASQMSVTQKGPISFPDLATARANLNAPADANYVMWNSAWPVNRDLEDVFATELAANDILVLPERAQPYVIDSSEGFRAAGVKSVTGRNGQITIVNQYKGIRAARTWFAMARARRGVLGLGPGAVIQMSTSSWTMEPQIQDKGSVQSDGWTSPGRYWTNTSNVVQYELVGCQEKMLESAHANSYFGNFAMRGRSLGGIACNGIVATRTSNIFEHLDITAGWRGFQPVPNGEAGAIASGGGSYFISRCILGTRDSTNTRVGTSPIMINSSTGGGTIEDIDARETYAGMLTIWNSTGTHTLNNVNLGYNWGPAINLEKCQSGMILNWNGGTDYSDYQGNGGTTGKPSDQGTKGGLHLNVFAETGSAKITLRGVLIDRGPTAGSLNVQSYGNTVQKLADIKCYDANNNAIPVKAYGTIL